MEDTESLFEIFRSASKNCKNKFFIFDKNLFKNKKDIENEEERSKRFLELIGLANDEKDSNADKVCEYDKNSDEILKSENIYQRLNIKEKDFFSLVKICIKTDFEKTGFLKLVKKAIKILDYIQENDTFYAILKFFYIAYKLLDDDVKREYHDQKGFLQLLNNFRNYGNSWLKIENKPIHTDDFTETIHNAIISYYFMIHEKFSHLEQYENFNFEIGRKNKKNVGDIINTQYIENHKNISDKVTKYKKNPNGTRNIYALNRLKNNIYLIYTFLGKDYILYDPFDLAFLKHINPRFVISCSIITNSKITKSRSKTDNVPIIFMETLRETWNFIENVDVKKLTKLADIFMRGEFYDLADNLMLD